MFQKILILTILFTGSSITSIFAQQKFGHLNSGNMLELMPEVKESDKKLAVLDDSLGVQLDTMTAKFKRHYDAALKAVNEGTMTKIQQSISKGRSGYVDSTQTSFACARFGQT